MSKKGKKTVQPTEHKELKALFDEFDVNNDGKLSKVEFKKMFRCAGFNPTKNYLDKCMAAIDKDDKGIDFDKFIEITKMSEMSRDPKEQKSEITKAFKTFDKNNDGFIDKDEFKYILTLGKDEDEPITEAEIDKAWKDADTNGDGVVSYEEFAKMWASV